MSCLNSGATGAAHLNRRDRFIGQRLTEAAKYIGLTRQRSLEDALPDA
jgi:hypothetical protein